MTCFGVAFCSAAGGLLHVFVGAGQRPAPQLVVHQFRGERLLVPLFQRGAATTSCDLADVAAAATLGQREELLGQRHLRPAAYQGRRGRLKQS